MPRRRTEKPPSKQVTEFSNTTTSRPVTDSLTNTVNNTVNHTVTTVNNTVDYLIYGGQEKSYQELRKIEEERRGILRRHDTKFCRLLFFWNGTVLKKVSSDPLMYISILTYVLVRVGIRYGLPDFVTDLGGADIAVIGAFLSFLLVFFVNNSAKAFDRMYEISMSCEHNILNITALAKTTLPPANSYRLVRYLNAAHIIGYIGLSDAYTKANFFDPINKANHFLTPKEVKRIDALNMSSRDGSAYRELIIWCCYEIQVANKKDLIDARLASQYRDYILKFQASMASLYNADDQPVSFSYLHFLSLSSALYLPLFAISAGIEAGSGDDAYWVNDLVAGLIVLLQCLFVIGLRILAVNMNSPYGDKLEDLSVMYYINHVWRESTRMLHAELPDTLDSRLEDKVHNGTQDYGKAWGWGLKQPSSPKNKYDTKNKKNNGKNANREDEGSYFELSNMDISHMDSISTLENSIPDEDHTELEEEKKTTKHNNAETATKITETTASSSKKKKKKKNGGTTKLTKKQLIARWKLEQRHNIWDLMERTKIARNPRPVHNRIPNFAGSEETANVLSKLPEFQKALIVKVNQDTPQQPIRHRILEENKTLLTLQPGLGIGFFSMVQLSTLPESVKIEDCTTSKGVARNGTPVTLYDKYSVDLVVIGSTAVCPTTGARVGKGGGYAELEWGILTEQEHVHPERTLVITTVHEKQLVPGLNQGGDKMTKYDLPVDIIITPKRIIRVTNPLPKPTGVFWDLLSNDKLESLPSLKQLKDEIEERDGVTLPIGHDDLAGPVPTTISKQPSKENKKADKKRNNGNVRYN